MAIGWKIRSEGRVKYLDYFLTLSASAAMPAERDVDVKIVHSYLSYSWSGVDS